MKLPNIISALALLLPLAASAAAPETPDIIPCPQKIEMRKHSVRISGAPFTVDPAISKKSYRNISAFAEQLTLVGGKTCSVATSLGLSSTATSNFDKLKGFIFLLDASVPEQGYTIDINGKHIVITASDDYGFLYSLQTIRQMLPVAIYGDKLSDSEKWTLPCCRIEDTPRFKYRGMHLDCSRHFFSLNEIKKYLDVMAIYKLNRFHWHLTDDQGWRIQITRWPLLTEVGGFRAGTMIGNDYKTNDGIRYGGYYTKDQIREIIKYADNLGITIIPEVDLPGHMLAALAAYPHLGCEGGPYKVWERWGVSEDVLCPGKESTFEFLEDVLGEVADLFPSEYIHIGGDECPKVRWENCPECQARIKELGIKGDETTSAEQHLQNYVTNRVEQFLATKGKKVIGWDEIIEGEVSNNATIMSWRGTSGGIKAAKNGYDAIMTPTTYCYFDYKQSKDPAEPYGYSLLNMEKVYSYEPLAELDEEESKHILGVQANLWTEFISTNEHLEYMLLPRMLALSEVQWCKPEVKDYDRFYKSLVTHHYPLLESKGYNYRKY